MKWITRSNEIFPLITALLVSLCVGYFLYDTNVYILSLGIFIAILYVVVSNASLIGNSLLITPESLPKVNKTLLEVSEKIGIKVPKLYIQQSPELNAFSIGLSRPSIVITSGLFDIIEDEELEFVLGHESGHIFLKHNWISTIIYPAGQRIPIINYLFDFWSRQAEYNADLIGLFCSGNIEHSISALLKMAVGEKVGNSIKPATIINQKLLINDWFEKIGETLFTHPYSINRMNCLVQFYLKNDNIIKSTF